jgi:hypothetical protein
LWVVRSHTGSLNPFRSIAARSRPYNTKLPSVLSRTMIRAQVGPTLTAVTFNLRVVSFMMRGDAGLLVSGDVLVEEFVDFRPERRVGIDRRTILEEGLVQ